MTPAASRPRDPVTLFCKMVRATDLPTWLGVPAHDGRAAMVALERVRRRFEEELRRGESTPASEYFLEHYDAFRDAVRIRDAATEAGSDEAPDYYAVLGVEPGASYATIESAWRARRQDGRSMDPSVAQAWRVLGDPLNRSHYDRARRERAQGAPRPAAGRASDRAPTEPSDAGPRSDVGLDDPCHATVPGPELREVLLEGDEVVTRTIPLTVRGTGRWRATIETDHPAVRTRPDRVLSVGPGHHTLAVRFDPRRFRRGPQTVTVTLSNPREQHVVAFRVQHADATDAARSAWGARLGPLEPMVYTGIAALLILLGFWLGTTSPATAPSPQVAPDTLGDLSQLPAAAACFTAEVRPWPTHVDVHTDGLGRPNGFSFGGSVSPSVEACVRDALLRLDFPPTRDGLPALHRYVVPPLVTPGAP